MALAKEIPIEQLLGQLEDSISMSPPGGMVGVSPTATIGGISSLPDWWPSEAGGIGSETIGTVQITVSSSVPSLDQLRQKFAALVREWRRDTRFKSSLDDKVVHPSYLAIIGMGREALPLIFSDLQRTRDHWLVALHAIAQEDPAPPNASFNEAVDAWLSWGRDKGYL